MSTNQSFNDSDYSLLNHDQQNILILAHGRSGSTLLLEMLQQDPKAWTCYEPLQDVRQVPQQKLRAEEGGRCRDGPKEGSVLSSKCPLRDASLVVALLHCDTNPLMSVWLQELDIAKGKGAYLPHDGSYGSGWESSAEVPNLLDKRLAAYVHNHHRCRVQPMHVVKTIRMNGHLDKIFQVSAAVGRAPPLVLHLVRDIKAVYASRKALQFSKTAFGLPMVLNSKGRYDSVKNWSREMCLATMTDYRTGMERYRPYYRLLLFSDLIRNPNAIMEQIYHQSLQRSVPLALQRYIREHLQQENVSNQHERKTWQYQYGTTARDLKLLEHAWEKYLSAWEVQAIETGCGPQDQLPSRSVI